jgi:hypothetical protein
MAALCALADSLWFTLCSVDAQNGSRRIAPDGRPSERGNPRCSLSVAIQSPAGARRTYGFAGFFGHSPSALLILSVERFEQFSDEWLPRNTLGAQERLRPS